MTAQEGRGVQVLAEMVKELAQLDPAKAAAIFDAYTDQDMTDAIASCSAATVAQEGEVFRDVFDESIARRLGAVEARS